MGRPREPWQGHRQFIITFIMPSNDSWSAYAFIRINGHRNDDDSHDQLPAQQRHGEEAAAAAADEATNEEGLLLH